MKFNDENSNDYDVIKTDILKCCIQCDTMTEYVDGACHLPVCSKECFELSGEEFSNAFK